MAVSGGIGLADLFGIGTAAAAEAAPEAAAAVGGDIFAAGATDALGAAAATVPGDITGLGFGGIGTTADLGLAAGAAGGAATLPGDIAGLGFGGVGAADVLAAGGAAVPAADTLAGLQLASLGASDVGPVVGPANTAALTDATLTGTAPAAALATPGGGATEFGGVQTATAEIANPPNLPAISSPQGGGLGGLTSTDTGTIPGTLGNTASLDVAPGTANTGLQPVTTGTTPPTTTGLSLADAGSTGIPRPPADIPATGPAATPAAGTTPPAGGGTPPPAGGGTPPPTPPPAGGGGGFDWWKAAGLGLAAAPLGITLLRGESSLPPQSSQAQGLAGTVGAGGQQLLQSALTNTPMPGQQAILNQNRQGQMNALAQQIYNETGNPNVRNDPRWNQSVALIDQNIAAEQQAFITANLNAALQATGQASGTLTNIASQQIALDTAYQNAIANAGRSLGTTIGLAGTRLL